jgi:hypothetical protein
MDRTGGLSAIGNTPVARHRRVLPRCQPRADRRAARAPPGRCRAGRTADYDEVIAIPEARAFATARQAARDEGIFSGPSTGANLAAALEIAGRPGPGHRVVTLQVDSGLKYLTGPLYSS